MTDSPNLGLTFLEASQSQKHVTVNEGFRQLDMVVQPTVLDKDLTAPPASPAPGDKYLVAAGATGAWAGQENSMAGWMDGSWFFATPKHGWVTYVADENKQYVYDGASWILPSADVDLSGFAPITGAAFTGNISVAHTGSPSITLDTTSGSSRTAYLRMKGARTTTTSTIAQMDFVNNLSPEVTAASLLISGTGNVNLVTGQLQVAGSNVLTNSVLDNLNVGTGDFAVKQTKGDVVNVVWWDGSINRLYLGSLGSGGGYTELRAPLQSSFSADFTIVKASTGLGAGGAINT